MVDVFQPASDEPFTASGGSLDVLRTCWTMEAETGSRSGASLFYADAFSGVQASGTQAPAVRFDASGQSLTGLSFTPEYDIAADDFGLYLRASTSNAPAIEATANGTTWAVINDGLTTGGGGPSDVAWRDYASNPFSTGGTYVANGGGSFTAGTTYSVSFSSTSAGGSSPAVYLDLVAPLDTRYSYTFDNSVTHGGSANTLQGPEWYPAGATITATAYSQSYNITDAHLATTITDTSGQEALQVSNDGGTSWYPQDGSESNTQAVDVAFSTLGTRIQGRVTLGGYGSRSDATPSTGYQGQSLTEWTLDIDTNSVAVIDSKTYTGSHFENLQRLHADAGMVFVPDYDPGALTAVSLAPGEVEKSGDWQRLDYSPRHDVSGYANKLTVYGGMVGGSRVSVTATSESEIAAKGETIEAVLFKTGITNTAELKNIARVELGKRIAEDKSKGTVRVVPRFLLPGFGYSVPAFGGDVLTLARVSFRDGGEASGRLEFGDVDDLASVLTGIKTSVRDVKDVV